MTVAVITDSAATLPDYLARELGVIVVPLRLWVGSQQYRDGEISVEELLARFDEGVTTAGPAPGDYAAALAGADSAVVLTVARDLAASTYETARAASQELGTRVAVVDTRTAAGGQGLVAVAAAQAAARGANLAGVEKAARTAIEDVRVMAMLGDLTWLVKGGHVPGIAGWAVRTVGLIPIVELRNGKVQPHRPALSQEAALQRMLALWRATRPRDARLHLGALFAGDRSPADRLLEAVAAESTPELAFAGSFGTPMIVHSGPTLVGMSWRWLPPG